MTDTDDNLELLRAKLNLETAKIPWSELQRYFAAGKILFIGHELDLVEVALQISIDNQQRIQQWMNQEAMERVSDDLARQWVNHDVVLWAIVVKPWVLVQGLAE